MERGERVVMKWVGDYCGARPIIDIWRTVSGENPAGSLMAERLLVVYRRGLAMEPAYDTNEIQNWQDRDECQRL